MGVDSEAMAWLLAAFGVEAIFEELPEYVPVWIFDHTTQTKYLGNPTYKTGYEYLMDQFMRGPNAAFYGKGAPGTGARIVYGCLDRGRPANKDMESERRAKSKKKKERMPSPENENEESLLNDYRIPRATEWDSFIGNAYLTKRLIHYITMRLIGTTGCISDNLEKYTNEDNVLAKDFDVDKRDYTLPTGGGHMFCLFGGRLEFPKLDRPKGSEYPFPPSLLIFETLTREKKSRSRSDGTSAVAEYHRPTAGSAFEIGRRESEGDVLKAKLFMDGSVATENVRSVKMMSEGQGYTEEQLKNLLEGEVSCLFFSLNHASAGEKVVITTPDFDTLAMALLLVPDLLDPITFQPVSKIYVRMTLGRYKNKFIDVYRVWRNMYESRPLKENIDDVDISCDSTHAFDGADASVEYPSKLCALAAMCGTDYVDKFHGIGSKKTGFSDCEEVFDRAFSKKFLGSDIAGEIKNRTVPWVFFTFLKRYDEFCDFIAINRTENRNVAETVRKSIKVDVNETVFIDFVRAVYFEKYVKFVSGGDDRGENGSKVGSKRKRGFSIAGERPIKRIKYADENASAVSTKSRSSDKVNVDRLIAYLKARKDKRERLPVPRELRVRSRNLLWQMLYWFNSYRGNCSVLDPTTLYRNMPYYGWRIGKDGRCKFSKRVSKKPEKPIAPVMRHRIHEVKFRRFVESRRKEKKRQVDRHHKKSRAVENKLNESEAARFVSTLIGEEIYEDRQ
jgi:hypothetical protein